MLFKLFFWAEFATVLMIALAAPVDISVQDPGPSLVEFPLLPHLCSAFRSSRSPLTEAASRIPSGKVIDLSSLNPEKVQIDGFSALYSILVRCLQPRTPENTDTEEINRLLQQIVCILLSFIRLSLIFSMTGPTKQGPSEMAGQIYIRAMPTSVPATGAWPESHFTRRRSHIC